MEQEKYQWDTSRLLAEQSMQQLLNKCVSARETDSEWEPVTYCCIPNKYIYQILNRTSSKCFDYVKVIEAREREAQKRNKVIQYVDVEDVVPGIFKDIGKRKKDWIW